MMRSPAGALRKPGSGTKAVDKGAGLPGTFVPKGALELLAATNAAQGRSSITGGMAQPRGPLIQKIF